MIDKNLYEKAKIMFIKENYNMTEIQKILGINRKKLSKKFKEDNIYAKNRISPEQLKEAIKMYNEGETFTVIAKTISCDRHSISTKLKELNIIENKKELTKQEHEIIDHYINGENMLDISKRLNIPYKRVQELIRTNNVKRYSISKYSFNKNIFKFINTEEKAYWLGFLYADGYIAIDRGVELTLAAKDKKHLEKFKLFTESNKDIKFKEKTNAYRFCIESQELARDLTKLGCFQNKSLTLKFPTEKQVPNHLIHHFMRGYFDGDGCISVNTLKKNYVFTVLGTDIFLDKYEEYILNILNRTNPNIRPQNGRASSIQYGGKLQLIKIFNFLYKDATIYLERKFNKFAVLGQDHMKS